MSNFMLGMVCSAVFAYSAAAQECAGCIADPEGEGMLEFSEGTTCPCTEFTTASATLIMGSGTCVDSAPGHCVPTPCTVSFSYSILIAGGAYCWSEEDPTPGICILFPSAYPPSACEGTVINAYCCSGDASPSGAVYANHGWEGTLGCGWFTVHPFQVYRSPPAYYSPSDYIGEFVLALGCSSCP